MINPITSERKPSKAERRKVLEDTHRIVSSEIKNMEKKVKKMKRLIRQTRHALKTQEIKNKVHRELQSNEEFDYNTSLDVNFMQKMDAQNRSKYEVTCEALDGLSEEIGGRINDVHNQTELLKQASYEWQASHNILADNYERFLYQYYEKLNVWNQTVPVMNTWLNSEGQLQRSIYASAWLFGLQTELNAQVEIKKLLEDFEETHYSRLSSIPANQLPTMKQVQEQRQGRSEAFDQLHWRLLKQLRLMVKQCDYLQLEIESREHIRLRLKALTMEFFNAVEEDVGKSHRTVREELSRSLGQILTKVLNLPEADKKEMVENFMSLTSLYSDRVNTMHPSTFDTQSIINNPQPSPTAENGYRINHLDAAGSMISSLSDEASLSLNNSSNVLNKHSTYNQLNKFYAHPTKNLTPEAAAAVKMYHQADTLLNITSKPYQAFRTLSIQSKDLSKNMTRIHHQVKECLASIKHAQSVMETEEDKGEGKEAKDAPASPTHKVSQRDISKDPMFELLMAKRVVQKLQNSILHSSRDCITTALESEQEVVAKDLAAKYKAQQREEIHLKKFAAFAHAKQEVEQWMEMGIIDKYKVALNLVHTELAKHDITLPTPISINTYNSPDSSSPRNFGRVQYVPSPRAADIQILRLQPSKSQDKPAEEKEFREKKSSSDVIAVSKTESKEEEKVDSLAVGEEQFLQDSENLLHLINRQMSVDYEEIMKLKKLRTQSQGNPAETQEYCDEQFEEVASIQSKHFDDANTMEIIMEGQLYHINLVLKSCRSHLYFVARSFVDRDMYREYIIEIPLDVFSDITGLPVEVVIHYLTEDRYKFYQHVKAYFGIETIGARHYDDLVDMLVLRDEKYEYTESEMEDMLKSIQDYQSMAMRQKQLIAEQSQYGYLLKVMVLRTKQKGLVKWAFAEQKKKT
eukprot:gene33138-40090_t